MRSVISTEYMIQFRTISHICSVVPVNKTPLFLQRLPNPFIGFATGRVPGLSNPLHADSPKNHIWDWKNMYITA